MDVKQLAVALLAALRVEGSGGDIGEQAVSVSPGESVGQNVQGTSVTVISSEFQDGTVDFAPFTLKTDNGQEVAVKHAFSTFRLGFFKRLTFVNDNANAGGIKIAVYAGYGDYERSEPGRSRIQCSRSSLIAANAIRNYTAGKVIGPSPLPVFSTVASVAGGHGYIVKARVHKTSPVVAGVSMRLYLFTRGGGVVQIDNSAWNVPANDTEAVGGPQFVGVIDFPEFIAESGAGGAFCEVVASVPFVCEQGSKDLYGVLVAESAFASAAVEHFVVHVWSDRH